MRSACVDSKQQQKRMWWHAVKLSTFLPQQMCSWSGNGGGAVQSCGGISKELLYLLKETERD